MAVLMHYYCDLEDSSRESHCRPNALGACSAVEAGSGAVPRPWRASHHGPVLSDVSLRWKSACRTTRRRLHGEHCIRPTATTADAAALLLLLLMLAVLA